MWTLIVLLVGVLPPTGMVQYGFDTLSDCMMEAKVYCNDDKRFVCGCSDKFKQEDLIR